MCVWKCSCQLTNTHAYTSTHMICAYLLLQLYQFQNKVHMCVCVMYSVHIWVRIAHTRFAKRHSMRTYLPHSAVKTSFTWPLNSYVQKFYFYYTNEDIECVLQFFKAFSCSFIAECLLCNCFPCKNAHSLPSRSFRIPMRCEILQSNNIYKDK